VLSECSEQALTGFVAESNRIEGILRDVKPVELQSTDEFIIAPILSNDLIAQLAWVYAGDKGTLRSEPGVNVVVGDHRPPESGPLIPQLLEKLLGEIQAGKHSPYEAHVHFETLHPFYDGNGRTGRALWLWQMHRDFGGVRALSLPFLHRFYYQTLDASSPRQHI
jgi:Fic family protein